MTDFRAIFENDWCGIDRFLKEVLSPVFGGYEEGYDILTGDAEVREKAAVANITEIRHVASFDFFMGELKVFDITVGDDKRLENNKVGIQALVRQYIGQFEGALLLFHHKNVAGQEWRFSYVEKRTNARDTTSAKRYTYILGKGQPARTISERFTALEGKQNNGDPIVLSDLTNAFSVAPLSNDFFDEYREHYADLVEYISGKRFVKEGGKFKEKETGKAAPEFQKVFDGDDKLVRDYVKKMMGRIVFLHFLQKKGWLGVPQGADWGCGDRNFIYKLFMNASGDIKKDFLEQALEPLFFQTLNTDRGGEALAPKAVCDIYGSKIRIPYLNGGLFEEDELDKKKVKFKEEHFAALLEFFSQYNFTIDETDPDDTEIGVDPEMLGKIFENLLEDNKDKGAFYTPKEIVQYMCRESLVAYLETAVKIGKSEQIRSFVLSHDTTGFTDGEKASLLKALLDVKICDPAVGSGAFPMGMLNELLACMQLLAGTSKSRADIKKHIVKNNIYGVDIEKGAVDIARLRFWLAIIVDEKEPLLLPNLDYKIMQGNSLLECYEGIDLSKLCERAEGDLFDDADDIKTLLGYLNSYYDTHSEKQAIRDVIKTAVMELLRKRGISGKAYDELSAIDLHENSEFFLWHTWFSDVFNRPNACNGFDIVIGNPPYIEAKKLKFISSILKNLYTVYSGTADLSIYFIELGMNLLCNSGTMSFITTNKFFNTEYGKQVRKFISQKHIEQLINFEQVEVFEGILVSSVILIAKKMHICIDNKFVYQQFYKMKSAEFKNKFVDLQGKFGIYPQDVLGDNEWSFSSPQELLLKEKIEKGNTPVKDLDGVHVYRGITTGYNPAFIITTVQRDDFIKKDPESADIIKNMLQGRNIRKWYYNESDEYLLQTGFDIDIEHKYPLIYEHLKAFKEELEARADQGKKWYNLRACKYYKDFESPEKIIWGLTADKWAYTLDKEQHYLPSNAYILTSEQIPVRFILGLLNSKLLQHYFTYIGIMTAGGAYTLKAATIESLPIPSATPAQQKPIIDLVDKILAAKKADSSADTSPLEAQIDKLVYALYGLTEDEIAIVEGR